MATVVIMPKLGLTMTAGAVAQWNVLEGQRVTPGEIIVEVTTEKITYQVEAQADGVLVKIVVSEGEEVPVGATIGIIGEPGEDITALLNGGGSKTRIASSPAARKRAGELGVDLAAVTGTGPGGRITIEDVNRAAENAGGNGAGSGPPARPSGAVAGGTARPGGASTPEPATGPDAARRAASEELPYLGMRRAIGEHMAVSWSTSPMVTHHVRATVHELVQLLEQVNEGRSERDKVSITAAVVKAVAASIRAVPRINATLDGETIKVWQDINVGVAVALPDGLIVPVVRQADRKGLGEIAHEVAGLARRARKNKLLPEEVTGGTFTVSSIGAYRSVDWFTPIINQPEAAILGVGRLVEDVVAVDGSPAVRPTMGLSLTFDHRVIDGAPAAEFLRVLLDYLERPVRMLV